jgi:hypothetical protein
MSEKEYDSLIESMLHQYDQLEQQRGGLNPFYDESKDVQMPTSIEELSIPRALYHEKITFKAWGELKELVNNVPQEKSNPEIKSLVTAFRFVCLPFPDFLKKRRTSDFFYVFFQCFRSISGGW